MARSSNSSLQILHCILFILPPLALVFCYSPAKFSKTNLDGESMKNVIFFALISLVAFNVAASTVSISDSLNSGKATQLKNVLLKVSNKNLSTESVAVTNLKCLRSVEVTVSVDCSFIEEGRRVELNSSSAVKASTLYTVLEKAGAKVSNKKMGSLFQSEINAKSVKCQKDMTGKNSCKIVQ